NVSARAGTACAGRTFTISLDDPTTGELLFTPSAPFNLGSANVGGPASTCIIDFTFDAVQLPTIDVSAIAPGIQTAQLSRAVFTDVVTQENAGAQGSFSVTFHQVDVATTSNPTLTDGDQAPGVSVTDTATVTGTGPTPTGTVDFYLCQPGDVTAGGCPTGGTLECSGVVLDGNGVATCTTTNTSAAGTYCWRAEYSDDAVYNPASHTNETTECFTVVAPRCGDETIDPALGETCDPPGVPGPNTAQPGICRASCTYCGDGIMNNGEQCDDGNGVNFDGCNNDCEIETCNVLVDKGVDCGTGQVDVSLVSANDDGTNGCSADNGDTIMVGYQVQNTGNVDLVNCNLTDSNGNIIAPGPIGTVGAGNTTPILFPTNTPLICSDALEAGEPDTATVVCECGAPQSGLGQVTAFDTADFECLPICGDGNIDPGETCDPPGQPGPNTAQPGMCRNSGSADQCTYCGDGIRQAAEDGVDGDGCSNICESEDVPVPTMNEWGMILFVIFAGLGAVYYLRRKRFNS
ncbi:MAG: IPTL-CTERM sorting domain-containing protein, partial [Planctomycetota bacterium]